MSHYEAEVSDHEWNEVTSVNIGEHDCCPRGLEFSEATWNARPDKDFTFLLSVCPSTFVGLVLSAVPIPVLWLCPAAVEGLPIGWWVFEIGILNVGPCPVLGFSDEVRVWRV